MISIQKQLSNLEKLLELDYEKLQLHREELSISSNPNIINEMNQRIKHEIMPRIRENEAEYWSLLRQFLNENEIPESDAQAAITTVIQNADEIGRLQPVSDEISRNFKKF